MQIRKFFVVGLMLIGVLLLGNGCPGLNLQARMELEASGGTQYLGQFEPVSSEDIGDGWVKHTYDPDGGDGPICIAGTPFSVFTNAGNPSKLLIMLQGGEPAGRTSISATFWPRPRSRPRRNRESGISGRETIPSLIIRSSTCPIATGPSFQATRMSSIRISPSDPSAAIVGFAI